MDVVSHELPVGSVVWQPRSGTYVLTVVCKITLSLRPGESPLASEQEGLCDHERHRNNDPSQSLYAPNDLAPGKPYTDILLVGSAFSPGKSVQSLVARLVIGDLDKSMEVHCDRFFKPDGSAWMGQPFQQMPLVYERAAGGPGTQNPVGIRPATRNPEGMFVLPNLQRPGQIIQAPRDVIEPIGFGPIAASWPLRLDKLGSSAANWSERDWHQKPFPGDLDPVYFNAAPLDQRVGSFKEGSRVFLEHLHPQHAKLVTTLSSVQPRVIVSSNLRPCILRCDTLWIDTDRALCTLTYRGQIPLQHPKQDGSIEIALSQPKVMATQAVHIATGPSLPFAGASGRAQPEPVPPVPAQPSIPAMVTPSQPVVVPSPPPLVPSSPSAASGSPYKSPWASSASSSAPAEPAPPEPLAPLHSTAPSTAQPVATPSPPAFVPSSPYAASDASSSDSAYKSPWASGGSSSAGAVQPAPIRPVSPAPSAVPERGTYGSGVSANLERPRVESIRAQPALAQAETGEILELVGFEPLGVPRIRRKFRKVIAALEQKPLDPSLDDPSLAVAGGDADDRRVVFEILAHGPVSSAMAIDEALLDGVREGCKFAPQLVLVSGQLGFPFDELEMLRATVSTLTPLCVPEDALESTLKIAKEFLSIPDLVSAPAVAEGLTKRLRDSFLKGQRAMPASYLEEQTERALLEQRHYQQRSILGGPHVRALLDLGGSSTHIPTYLSKSLAEQLPMYERFKARLIAEVHLALDQVESHPAALRVLALLRLARRL